MKTFGKFWNFTFIYAKNNIHFMYCKLTLTVLQ